MHSVTVQSSHICSIPQSEGCSAALNESTSLGKQGIEEYFFYLCHRKPCEKNKNKKSKNKTVIKILVMFPNSLMARRERC